MNLFAVVYQGAARPYIQIFQNRLQLINECFVALMTYSLLLFTEYVWDRTKRYDISMVVIFVLLLAILMNLVFMITLQIKQLKEYLRIRKAKREFRRRASYTLQKMFTMSKGRRDTSEGSHLTRDTQSITRDDSQKPMSEN